MLAKTHSPALDGATDLALLALRPDLAEGDGVRTAKLTLRPRRRWGAAAAAALAATVLAVIGVSRLTVLRHDVDDGLKGSARVVTVSLSAVRRAPTERSRASRTARRCQRAARCCSATRPPTR